MKATTLLSLALAAALIHFSIAHEAEAATAPTTFAVQKDVIAATQNDVIATAARSKYRRPYYKKRYGHGRRYHYKKRQYRKRRHYGKKRHLYKKYGRYRH